jgi:hypothetical protein
LLLLSYSLIAKAQEAFDYLEIYSIPSDGCGLSPNEVSIRYKKNNTEFIEKKGVDYPTNHPLYDEYPDIISKTILLQTFIDSSTTVLIGFTKGLSCDLAFNFYDSKTFEPIGYASGTQLIIPGNGVLYSQGHNNSEFNMRKKYVFQDKKVTELFPELYYVGVNSYTLRPITIYSDWELSNKLAELPANYSVEVIAAKKPAPKIWKWKYLIKTSFGLIGWCKIEVNQDSLGGDIKGMYYKGD